MTGIDHEIRALLSPMAGSSILLPNNVVTEVIAFTRPDPVDQSPPWLLGKLAWNDWQVPVISFATLAGSSTSDPVTPGSRILILKSLAETASVMYLGVLINGLPRLKTLTAANMEILDENPESPSVFSRVLVAEEEALIPELSELAGIVEQAIYTP